MVPLALRPRQHALELLEVKGASVAVVPLFHRGRAALKQALALDSIRQNARKTVQPTVQRSRQLLKRRKRQRLLINGVAAKQFVRSLAGEHYLDMLACLLGHEEQRHQRGVSHRIIQVPHDLRNRVGVFLGRDNLDNVLHADRSSGLGGNVHLGVSLALKAGGKRQQVRVVTLGQRCNGCGVNAAGEEGAHGNVSAHVLRHRIFKRGSDTVVEVLLLTLHHGSGGEVRLEVAFGLHRATRGQRNRAAGLHATDPRVQALRLRNVLQVHVMLDCAAIQIQRQAQLRRHLQDGLLLGSKNSARLGCCVVQRLDAELVTGGEHRLCLRVPNDKGEHST